jgi:hypothetical protein
VGIIKNPVVIPGGPDAPRHKHYDFHRQGDIKPSFNSSEYLEHWSGGDVTNPRLPVGCEELGSSIISARVASSTLRHTLPARQVIELDLSSCRIAEKLKLPAGSLR